MSAFFLQKNTLWEQIRVQKDTMAKRNPADCFGYEQRLMFIFVGIVASILGFFGILDVEDIEHMGREMHEDNNSQINK